VVRDMERYQQFLVGKLLELPLVRDVRSSIANQSLKADAPLPLHHFDPDGNYSNCRLFCLSRRGTEAAGMSQSGTRPKFGRSACRSAAGD